MNIVQFNAETALGPALYMYAGINRHGPRHQSAITSQSTDRAPSGTCYRDNFCNVPIAANVTFTDCRDSFTGSRAWRGAGSSQCIRTDAQCVDSVGSCGSASGCDDNQVGDDCGGGRSCWPVPDRCEGNECCCGCSTNPD